MKFRLLLVFAFVSVTLFSAAPEELMNRKLYILTWRGVQEKPNENLFYSPYSIQQAMGMLSLGASGKTKEQIDQVFGFTPESLEWFAKNKQILSGKNQTFFFQTNLILADRNLKYDPAFRNSAGKYFDGNFLLLDFVFKSRITALLNRMIAVRSGNLIKDPFSEHDFSPEMIMLLANILAFKAPWEFEFDKSRTTSQPFLSAGQKKTTVELMHQKSFLPYFHDASKKIHGVSLPYKDNRFEMIILMTTKPDVDVSVIPQALSEGALEKWSKAFSDKKQTNLYFPKFKLSVKTDFSELLKSCGVRDAFLLTKADFSRLGNENLCVDNILHIAQIEVDETGTEAAAATVIPVVEKAAAPAGSHYFRVDRPFCFLIRYKPANAILFLGVIHQLPGK
ncbi:MAG: serpin family protein [Lentisphaeria bacterium]|nr:serpin family protein [Lentisphaeria bacterium]